jgi:hypothetical protein
MSETRKPLSERDGNQVLQGAFNDVDKSITVGSFVVGRVGHKISRTNTAGGDLGGASAGDDFAYYDNGVLLYTIRVLYSDVDKEILLSVERVQ